MPGLVVYGHHLISCSEQPSKVDSKPTPPCGEEAEEVHT